MLWARIRCQYTREEMEDWLFNSWRKEPFHTWETRRMLYSTPTPWKRLLGTGMGRKKCWTSDWELRRTSACKGKGENPRNRLKVLGWRENGEIKSHCEPQEWKTFTSADKPALLHPVIHWAKDNSVPLGKHRRFSAPKSHLETATRLTEETQIAFFFFFLPKTSKLKAGKQFWCFSKSVSKFVIKFDTGMYLIPPKNGCGK